MARRSRQYGSSYQKRPVRMTFGPDPVDPSIMRSTDAHELASHIKESQTRWRVQAIRLVGAGACCVVVLDSQSGEEAELRSVEDWQRLRAEGASRAGGESARRSAEAWRPPGAEARPPAAQAPRAANRCSILRRPRPL